MNWKVQRLQRWQVSFCGKNMSAVCMNMARVFNYYNGTMVQWYNGHFCYVFCYSFLTRLSDYI